MVGQGGSRCCECRRPDLLADSIPNKVLQVGYLFISVMYESVGSTEMSYILGMLLKNFVEVV